MADKIQALVGNNPMIKSVMSNPEHMAKAQEMLRNPEMQKQIGGVISNPAVIKQASEVLNGLQQMNTIQAGGRKIKSKRTKRMARKTRKRRGGQAMTPEAQYRTNRDNMAPMGCPRFSGHGACNAAKQKAFNNPSDMGKAWWNYNMNYLEGQMNKGKMGDAKMVFKRLRKWVEYMNEYNASLWPELKWYDEEQEKRRQLVNSRFYDSEITRPKAGNTHWPLADKITNLPPGREGYKGLLTHDESGEKAGFIRGGKRKSRRKKRRKSKKRKSRRRRKKSRRRRKKSRRRRRR